jgi:hypothetical protein
MRNNCKTHDLNLKALKINYKVEKDEKGSVWNT